MDHLCFFMSCVCVCHAFPPVYCCLVVTCWERADHLTLVCGVNLCFCHFCVVFWVSVVLDFII